VADNLPITVFHNTIDLPAEKDTGIQTDKNDRENSGQDKGDNKLRLFENAGF
jgi:hypothetical protein